jgi:uracil DNA glycosylase
MTKNTKLVVDIEATKNKLYNGLRKSGWGDKLKSFILSEDFSKILLYLVNDVNSGNRFTPVLKQVFRAFDECPYKDLKVVMLGQD